MKGYIVLLIVCAVICCCSFTHRRVIKALNKHEPTPPAPKWHFWCKNRRN